MNAQMNSSIHLAPKAKGLSPQSPSGSRSTSLRHHTTNRGHSWLLLFAGLFVAGMAIGIIFTAHHYFHTLGGQGFLKTRSQEQQRVHFSTMVLHRPLRKVQQINLHKAHVWWKRSAKGVPFYACGDQQNSCEAYLQPVGIRAVFIAAAALTRN